MDEEVARLLLNGMPFKEFIVFYVIAIVGAIMLFLRDLNKSLTTDKTTPMTFEWRYFWKGFIRVVMALISLAFGVAFFEELSPYAVNVELPATAAEALEDLGVHAHDVAIKINALSALMMGLGADQLMKALVGTADDGRKAIMNKMKRNGT